MGGLELYVFKQGSVDCYKCELKAFFIRRMPKEDMLT